MVSGSAKNTKEQMAGEGSGSPKQPVPVTEGPVAQIRSGTQLQPEAPDRLLTAPTPASG